LTVVAATTTRFAFASEGRFYCLWDSLGYIMPKLHPPVSIPLDVFVAVKDRHSRSILTLPGVQSFGIAKGYKGLVVTTSRPELIPSELEGIPIFTKPVTGEIGPSVVPPHPMEQ
jgi:hypothetical protein